MTETLAVDTSTPPSPSAVNVDVVVVAGETALEPREATVPTEGLIATRLALNVVQDNVADAPGAMVEGEAVNPAVGSRRGPKIGTGSPRSNAPRSGAAPVNAPSSMFGRITPASTAGHPACSVIL